jgi:hypothetical protein
MNDKYYVIAGNHEEFKAFILRKAMEMTIDGNTSISLSDFVYVSGPETIKGLRNPRGFFFGTWRKRTDLKYILPSLLHQTDVGSTARGVLSRLCTENLSQ